MSQRTLRILTAQNHNLKPLEIPLLDPPQKPFPDTFRRDRKVEPDAEDGLSG
jgi:hypothetical protein